MADFLIGYQTKQTIQQQLTIKLYGNRPANNREIPRFVRNQKFSTVIARARHLSLPWARQTQSTPSHPNL